MSEPFPHHPNLVGGFAPIHMECDASDLIVEGEVPQDLNGTFYRNGPNPQFAPRAGYHWFAGDGMIHAFHIEDGKVSYRNRWPRTVKFKREREAGRSLFNPFNPMDTDPSVQGVDTDGLANTNIVWHGNKLLALEEGHAPFELDPHTLESRGAWTFDDSLVGPMTAHPKIDPETGEMVFFGYSVDGMLSNKMSYHVVDRDGKLVVSQFFDAPYGAMVHDFMVTRDYVVFPIMPLTGSLDRAIAGGPAFAWEPEKGNYIGVMRRDGSTDDIRWFRSEASYVFHPMNAWNEGEVVTCDVSEYKRAPLFPNADGSAGDASETRATLNRWTLDLGANTDDYRTEVLQDVNCEFGRLDERHACDGYRHGYMLCDGDAPAKAGGFNAIGHVDHESGRLETFSLPAEFGVSEAVFVPKSENASEGEGYLLSVVYNAETDKSHLMILDANNLSGDPLARAHLDHRVPYGFHGNWRPA